MKQKSNDVDDVNLVSSYIKDVKKIKFSETEIELYDKIRNRDSEAIKKMTELNLKFVIKIAKEYEGNGLQLCDLISEGNYGLIKAAEKFNPDLGNKFVTYAVWWIRQSIIKSINDNSRTVRIPVNVFNRVKELNKGGENVNLTTQYADYTEMVKNNTNEKIWDETSGKTTNDIPTTENDFATKYDNERINNEIKKILKTLDDREYDVIASYFGINKNERSTLEEIGTEYGLTKERVRQIKEDALLKLRHNSINLIKLMK